MNRSELTELTSLLCRQPGISGDETQAAQTAAEILRRWCPDARIMQGNVTGTCGSTDPDAPHVLLDAHMDQVGLIVTSVTDDGFITAGNVGGLDRRLFPDQRVKIFGTQEIYGIVSCLPPHLTNGEEKVLTYETLRIDTGYPAEALREIVHPGDSIVFDGVTGMLPGGRFTSPALDDRCGVAAILYALDELKGEELPCKVTVLFSAQEEVGERGAAVGCYTADPDIALAVDVSFAGDRKFSKTGRMGEGAMIGYSPSLSREVSDDLTDAALAEEIPYQVEVMAGTTGTNADRFSVCRGGVKACTVSIPLDYMHTAAEVIDLADVEYTGRLLAAYLRRCVTC